jgi:hypothetical protein
MVITWYIKFCGHCYGKHGIYICSACILDQLSDINKYHNFVVKQCVFFVQMISFQYYYKYNIMQRHVNITEFRALWVNYLIRGVLTIDKHWNLNLCFWNWNAIRAVMILCYDAFSVYDEIRYVTIFSCFIFCSSDTFELPH